MGCGDRSVYRQKVLSLAICKRVIRTNAKKGDLVVGISSREMDGPRRMGRLIYFAEVENILSGVDYYLDRKYRRRLDCAYKDAGGGRAVIRGTAYPHSQNQKKYFPRDI